MDKVRKDQWLTATAITILFITALVNWTVSSWLILISIIILLVAWYLRK